MKQNIVSAFFSILALMVAGCASETFNDLDSSDPSGESILKLEINMEDLTRVTLDDTSFKSGDEVLVVVTDRNNPDLLTVTTKATYTDGSWKMADKIDLASETNGATWSTADVQVYYPYKIAFDGYDKETGKITLKSTSDILYGSSSGCSKNNPSVKVLCKHALTRLTFAVTNNLNEVISEGILMVKNYGTINVLGTKGILGSNGIETVTDHAHYISMNIASSIQSGQTLSYDMLILPDPAAIDQMWALADQGEPLTYLKCEYSFKGQTFNFDIKVDNWEAGQQYIYPVNISEPKNPYVGEIGGHEYVDLGGSVLWATCNLGAESPYESGLFYQWGDTRGYAADSDYWLTCKENYIFKDWDLDVLSEEGVVVDGTLNSNYDAANQAWGSGWRMPTETELKELVDNCNLTWDSKNKGTVFESRLNGEKIILPPAGEIMGNSWTSQTEYWTSTADGYYQWFYQMTRVRAMFLSQVSYHFNPNPLYFGLPIRPVIDRKAIDDIVDVEPAEKIHL